MYDIQDKLGVKNISDLTTKAIKGTYNTENLTKDQTRKYKTYGKHVIADLTGIYVCKDLAFKIIMYFTVPTAAEFSTKLGFNPHDPIIRKK